MFKFRMTNYIARSVGLLAIAALAWAQDQPAPDPAVLPDAVQEAQTPRDVPKTRPEQQLSEHDQSGVFAAPNTAPASTALETQPDKGQILGFDFVRDPLNAKTPMQTLDEIMKEDIAAKPAVMEQQRQLLEARYNLTPNLDPAVTMSRGKPICVGPTARVAQGMTFEKLASMTAAA